LQLSAITRIGSTWAAAAACAGALLAALASFAARLFNQPIQNLPLLAALGAILFLLSAGLHYTALAAEASRAAEQRAVEAGSLARDAELHALRMQINPHFLFNSLHSIAALATQDGPRARDMCVRLSEFLRGSLGLASRDDIPLSEELALARSYLSVEQVRFGARLKIAEDIAPDCENCGIPALLLQPLVENAVKHGIAGMLEGGEIRLTVARREDQVVVTLENPFDPDAPAPTRLGMGLAHVRRRLEVRYAAQARLQAAAHNGIYRVELQFPCA
jgi:LytS/YehU family sensor histidine kinase